MKAIKTLMAASVVAAAGAAHATVWDMSITDNQFFAAANGPLVWSGTGTYDDGTNTATYHGKVELPAYSTWIEFDQVITMDETTGKGNMATLTNCTDNAVGNSCTGFSPMLKGGIRNTLGGDLQIGNPDGMDPTEVQSKTAVAFTPTDGGVYTWTLQVYNSVTDASGDAILVFSPTPLVVTLSAQQAPAVPVPAAAWLFGSGLLGLAGTARRRRAA